MQLIIYTEDKTVLAVLQRMTVELFRQTKQCYEVKIISNTGMDTAAWEEGDIYILDLDDKHSIRIASHVRQNNFNSAIVFLSRGTQLLQASMIFRPPGYFVLPIQEKLFQKRLYDICREQASFNRYLVLKNRERLERIPYHSIAYMESSGKKVLIHLGDEGETYVFSAKLEDVFRRLPAGEFVRCHQSYIVGLNFAQSIDKEVHQFVLFSGRRIDISRRMYTETCSTYETYLLRKRKYR